MMLTAYLAHKLPGSPLDKSPLGWAREAYDLTRATENNFTMPPTPRQSVPSVPLKAPERKEDGSPTPTPRQSVPTAHKWLAGAIVLGMILDEAGPFLLVYIYT